MELVLNALYQVKKGSIADAWNELDEEMEPLMETTVVELIRVDDDGVTVWHENTDGEAELVIDRAEFNAKFQFHSYGL